MGGAKVRASFVGRGPELDRLDAALARSAQGAGVTVLCGGEAGIGKTRLVSEFQAHAEADGCAILAGGCVELGVAGLPYGPFAEALRSAVDSGTLEPAQLRDAVVDQLSLIVPHLARRRASRGAPATELSGLGQVRLFEAVLTAITGLARERRVVLVIEDLHWADRSTQDLLSFLVRNVERSGFLILTTIRTDAVDRDTALANTLGELSRRPVVERIDLGPLDLQETADQLRVILGREPEDDLLRRIHRRSDGNPFYIEQLAWAHMDGDDTAMPPSLRDILLAQLSRQSTDVQWLLGAAAVAGPGVDERFLAEVMDRPEQEILEPIREAVRARLLVATRDEGYGFRHALMAEAIESDLLDADRRRLHARSAAALEGRVERNDGERAQRAARIAYHRDRAGDVPGTIVASVRAALAAEAVAAHRDALVRYRRAIELLDLAPGVEPQPGWDVAELFHRAAVCAAVSGEPKEAARLIRAALERLAPDADPHRRGRLLIDLGEHLWLAGDADFADVLELAAGVIPAEPPTGARAEALIALGYHHQFRGDIDAARRVFQDACATAIAAGSPRDEAAARNSLGAIDYETGDIAGGDAEIGAALAVIRGAPPAANVSVVYLDLSAVAAWGTNDELGAAIAREGLALAREHGFESYYGAAIAANGAECLLSLGRLHEAWELLGATEPIAAGGWSDTSRLITRSAVATALGDLASARADMVTTAPWADTGDRTIGRWRAVNLAELTVAEGALEDVAGVVAGGLALPPTHVPWEDHRACLYWLDIRAQRGLRERALARRDARAAAARAEAIAHGLDALERMFDTVGSESSPTRRRARAYQALARAEAGPSDTPDPDRWHAAIDAWAGLGWVLRPLYARIRAAEAYLEAGRAGRATGTAILLDAHAEAVDLGAGLLARLAENLALRARVALDVDRTERLRAVGPGSASVGPANVYGLTTRELEILPLIAAGLSNRQIGERLFISPKTAGVHVSNILGKLGVASRIQAATIADRLGIAADIGSLSG
ncbi:MAG TPA: AAA family ATPase [Candidatus Limnocylindrales bacterium]